MDNSIYELITELVDKHIKKRKSVHEITNIQSKIKKLRSKAFEILLKKKHTTEFVNELEGNTDPICHLLAWQYTLKNELDQPEKAETLSCFIKYLENSELLKDSVVQNMILFLLHLRGSCAEVEDKYVKYDILDKVILKHKNCAESPALPYDHFPPNKFHFPKPKVTSNQKEFKIFSLKSFTSEPSLRLSLSEKSLNTNANTLSYYSNYKFVPLSIKQNKIEQQIETKASDEGYSSPGKETKENIWDLVSKLPVNNHRTWESLDNIDPKKELPFACESGSETLYLLQKIANFSSFAIIDSQDDLFEEVLVSNNKFNESVKNMAVGITSDIFLINDKDQFYLKNGVYVEGISAKTLKFYCTDLIFCGSCYRYLNKLCSINSCKSTEENGYIFKELRSSINRYLVFYRAAVLSCPDSSNLLKLHAHMKPLRPQIGALTRLCKAKDSRGQQLKGAELLNFMYQEIIGAVDKNLELVLYSIFFPCCQIYFSRFLQRWLFEGLLIDPYEEFIIKSESDYTNSRARTYWTRSFSLQHNTVPEFLSEHKTDILQCGKTMNLLKLCNPDAALHTHIMSRTLPLISCCVISDHVDRLKQEIDKYYVKMASLCGPRISLYHTMKDRYGNEENPAFLSIIEKKRALTFKEMELKKQQEVEEKAKQKRKIFEEMREQVKIAAEQKRKAKEDELKEELLIAEQNAQIEELRVNIVKEESKVIIKYYDNLIEAVDKRRNSFEIRKQKLIESEKTAAESKPVSSTNFNLNIGEKKIVEESEIAKYETKEKSLEENIEEIVEGSENNKSLIESISLPKESSKILDLKNANILSSEELYNQKNETFLAAQRNRAKILNLEFDSKLIEEKTKTKSNSPDLSNLTDAQKNKFKVMSSEFDVYLLENNKNHLKNPLENNRTSPTPLITKTSEESTDNNLNSEVIVSKISNNLASPGHEDVMNIVHRKNILKLPKSAGFLTIFEKTNDGVIPMSVDSTPNTEISELPTPFSGKLSLNTDICFDSPLDSALLTANSNTTDDGFKFPVVEQKKNSYESYKFLFTPSKNMFSITQNNLKVVQSMRVSKNQVRDVKNGNLKSLLYQSVFIPLKAQMELVNNEIIKYFINDQHFFAHLQSLRNYYFLLDGEFCRNITESLFTKLYESKNPIDLLSCRSLQLIIDSALHASSKIQENGEKLSFIVRNIPANFDFSSVEVFECLSLSYRLNWPINILLPFDTIEKYDLIFKYLLKLHYMSWVLQKVFQELKNSQKEYGIDENLLLNSPQYHKIQLYRHVMCHFIQTLQNYTICEVLQTSWEEFENNLKSVTTLDQLYNVHVLYIKTIMFRCLLNRKCEAIMKVIREIFLVILKFYNYLRSRAWNLKENDIYYTHPNFKKLEYVFNKFEEFAIFVFRVGNKMAKVGYQPHLIQMLDMLNVNNYYTNKQKM